MKYAEPRYTKDLDLWVRNSSPNAERLYHALAGFGAPLKQDGITPQKFTQDGVVYQIGVAPVRIDVLTQITGVEFANACCNRVESTILNVPVYFISLADLIANKQGTGRAEDLERLRRIRPKT